MIDKQTIDILENTWKQDKYYMPMSEVSKSANDRGVLVDSAKKVFCLDNICKELYRKHTPKTADAVFMHQNTLIVAEFKTGFRDKIDLKKDKEKIETCEYLQSQGQKYTCNQYYKIFCNSRKAARNEQKASVYGKALDSYIVLMNDINDKHNCPEKFNCEIHFVLVIEDNMISSIDNMMAYFAEVSTSKCVEKINDNVKISLNDYLAKLHRYKDRKENFLYDDVKVFTASEFKRVYGF